MQFVPHWFRERFRSNSHDRVMMAEVTEVVMAEVMEVVMALAVMEVVIRLPMMIHYRMKLANQGVWIGLLMVLAILIHYTPIH